MAYDLIERLRTGRFTLMAEIGVNYYDIAAKLHISPIEAAKYMILAAANAGIHAVKFQTYKAETLASKYSPSRSRLHRSMSCSRNSTPLVRMSIVNSVILRRRQVSSFAPHRSISIRQTILRK